MAWTAPEFSYQEKSPAWFVVFGAIALLFFIIALLMKNYIFALVILLAAFVVYLEAKKYPREIRFAISEEGIIIDEKKILYEHITSFWVFERPERYISLHSKKLLQSRIHIPVGDQNPQKIRALLSHFAKEIEHEESVIDIFSRRLKF